MRKRHWAESEIHLLFHSFTGTVVSWLLYPVIIKVNEIWGCFSYGPYMLTGKKAEEMDEYAR